MQHDDARPMPFDAWLEGYLHGRAEGLNRGFDVATARAESRFALGLPIEYGVDLGLPPLEDDDANA